MGRGSDSKAMAKGDAPLELIRTNAGRFLRECDKKPWEPTPHSAKTKATLDLITKW